MYIYIYIYYGFIMKKIDPETSLNKKNNSFLVIYIYIYMYIYVYMCTYICV